jgi:phosphoglycolate phosphatase
MKYQNVFWDWNGTLINDLETSINSVNISLEKRGLPKITKNTYFNEFCFPVSKFYEVIGFDLKKESYETLANEFIFYYNQEVKKASLHPHASEVLGKLAINGVKLFILSASEKQILIHGLKKFGIDTLFSDLIALDNVYASGKIGIAKEWFNNNNIEGKSLMIGDTFHDYEVAQALNMDCILFTGGHTDREKLKELDVKLIDSYTELYDYVFDDELKDNNYCKMNKNTQQFVDSYKSFYDDIKTSRVDHLSDW